MHKLIIYLVFSSTILQTIHADSRNYNHKFNFNLGIGSCFNPLGVVLDSKLNYSKKLDFGNGILWENSCVDIGIENSFTPADNIISLKLRCYPIAFFEFNTKVSYYAMFDKLGYGFLGLESENSSYNTTVQKEADLEDATGIWVVGTPILKLKIKSLIFVNKTTVNYISIEKPQPFFLEIRSYLPHERSGIDIQNETILLNEFSKKFLCGFIFSSIRVINTNINSQRITCLLVKTFSKHKESSAHLIINGGAYIKDPLWKHKPYMALYFDKEFILH